MNKISGGRPPSKFPPSRHLLVNFNRRASPDDAEIEVCTDCSSGTTRYYRDKQLIGIERPKI